MNLDRINWRVWLDEVQGRVAAEAQAAGDAHHDRATASSDRSHLLIALGA